jgi:hypothetical protein
MDFYNIVIIVTLVLLIIALVLYGLSFKEINPAKYPESYDSCPTQWVNNGGICINPPIDSSNGAFNRIASIPGTTPGIDSNKSGFDPNDPGWAAYSGAKNAMCGKKAWAKSNNIQWNGINTYQC